jgi:exopolysaccharide production protein ExoQ
MKLLNGIVLGLVVFSTHQTILICYLEVMSPPRSCTYGSAQGQLSLLFVIVLLTFFVVRIRQEDSMYLKAWRQNWLIGLFVFLALVSVIWSIYIPATIYRSFLLLSVTAIAAYVGFRFSSTGLVIFVGAVVGVIALVSLLLAAILPDAAIMPNPPYIGLWRGIFWHKNYLGATMVLGCISYLVLLFSPSSQYTMVQKLLAGVMLVVCTGLAILSDSASGLITLAVQAGIFVLVLGWLSWGHLISRQGYWVAGGGLALCVFLLLANLEFVFGLFNRSVSMTGRVPLWNFLLDTYIAQRPLLGYGFGAFWLQPGINDAIQAVVDWGYPVKISDNGYIDVLLGLGVIGFALLLLMLGIGFRRVIDQALAVRDLTSFFPLFILIHFILVNISLSYIAEMESFIWFLFVVILFRSTKYEKASYSIVEKVTT